MATSAPSSSSSNKEKTNHTRLCRLLVDIGRQVLQDVFNNIHPPSTLNTVLWSPSNQNILKKLQTKKILFGKQWDTLFPASRFVTSADFDITLLFLLLRNICKLKDPGTGWDKPPLVSDLSKEADLVRIKIYRNELYAHIVNAAIPDNLFQRLWDDIEAALIRLGGSKHQVQIHRCKHDSLDPDCEDRFTVLLQSWTEAEKKTVDVIREESAEILGEIRELHEQIDQGMISIDGRVRLWTTGGLVVIWAAGSGYFLHRFRDNPETVIELVQKAIIPSFVTGAFVHKLLSGCFKILVKIRTVDALDAIWKSYIEGDMKKKLEEVVVTDDLRSLAPDDVKNVDISLDFSREEYIKTRDYLLKSALRNYDEAVDQNSSTSKKEEQTMDLSFQIDDNRSSSTIRGNTRTTSDSHGETNREHDLRLTTKFDQETPSNPEREECYPPGHGLPTAQGPSILGADCIFGPGSHEMPTNVTSDEIKTLSKKMDTANSQAESGKAAFHVVEESDTNFNSEEETSDYQVTSSPQPYDDDIRKQKRKERNNKRKKGPKATNKKLKTNEDGDNMEVDQQQTPNVLTDTSESKPSGSSQQATDVSQSHDHDQAIIQGNVHQPKSGSGQDGTSPSAKQTPNHDRGQPSIQENASPPNPNLTENVDCATIIFHALLSPDFNFKSSNQNVTVRLGHVELGGWNYNVADMFNVKKLDNYFLVHGKIQLPVQILYKPIPYKYVVVTGKGVEWEFSEFSDEHPGVFVNRSLLLPDNCRQPNAIWHQYDGVIYTEPKKGSTLWKFLTSILGTPNVDHAKIKKNREDACTLFFPKWCGFVTSSDSEPMTALEAVDSIKHLRGCLLSPQIFLGNNYSIGKTVRFDFQKILKRFLKPKITHNVGLKEEDLKDSTVRTNRLISSLVITYLIWFFKLDLSYVHLTDIIHCLVLGTSGHRCDFDEVHMHFPEHTWGEFSKAIVHLLKAANRKSKSGNFCPDIILAVPLFHFFCKDTKPFDKCDDGDEAKSVQTWCHSYDFPQYKPHIRLVQALFSKALPMFEMDPYFRRLFLCYVPYEDFPKIVVHNAFTEHELCMALGLKIKAEYISSTKMAEVEKSLSCLTTRIKTGRMQHCDKGIVRLAKSAFFLANQLFKKRVTSSKESFFTCIELVASSLCSIQSPGHEPVSAECQATKLECDVIFSHLLTAVEEGITRDFYYSLRIYRQKEEIQVWTRLLNISLVDGNLQERWCQSLLCCFEKRLKKLSVDDAIYLFCGMNSTDDIHLSLVEAITNHAFSEVERSVESGWSEKSIATLQRKCLQDDTFSRAGELLSRMLISAWNKQLADSEITLHKLNYIMNWKHWPVFISSFGSADNQKILTQDAAKLVQRVIDHLGSIQHAIKDRSIDVQTIVSLEQYKDNFRKLCTALAKIKDAEESPGFMKTDMVMKELQKRSDELRQFQDLRSHVHNFLNMCRSSKEAIFNTTVLQERDETDVSEMKVADICQRDPLSEEEQVSIIFFHLPDALRSDLPQLSSVCKSVIFQNFWKRKSRSSYKEKQKNVPKDGGLTLLEIHKQVLQPSIESWKQLAKSVHDGSITLGEIDKHFKDTSDQDIGKEIEMMFGLLKSTRHSTSRTIDERLKQIKQYRSLQRYIEAADTIWNFKKALGLKGDFEIVKQLQNQTSKEFKEKALTSIDGKFFLAARYLENISIEKALCLSAVIDCEPLVKWLRETIKDTSALSTLVDLAMISAGENDLEVDRISNFHTSCLNFAPLIFDVHKDLGFDELMEACQPVWKAVDSDKHLPEKLSETCRHLEWLKAVQSSHGSVEMSSLMQTKIINSSGVYLVGNISPSRDVKYGLESVLTLTVPMDERIKDPRRIEDQDIDLEGKEELKTYSLNDLKTLQSKLMLIAGKTVKLQHKDSIESTEEINKFVEIFEGVMRLGQVYIDLREAGDVKYLDWSEQVNCAEDAQFIKCHVGKKLAQTCFEMEERLKDWRQYVHDRRRKFQELNHFTTKQILVLRRELGALRHDGASLNNLPLNVYSLLESALNRISNYDLLEVLNTILGFFLKAEPTDSEMPPASDRENSESTNTENKYHSFFTTLGKMDFEEDVGIAALKAMDALSTQDFNETDLMDWCMENGENVKLITSLGEEAREDPDFIDFFPELKEEIQDDKQELQSEAMSSEEQNQSEDFQDFDVKQEYYLTLDELGSVLANLAVKGARPTERRFPDYLKNDQPNLILVPSDDLFQTVLTLYKQYGGESLPTPNEVLLCTSDTTAEEVELFWWRAYQDMHKQIFCLVNPDVLDYSVSQTSVNMFNVLKQKFGSFKECRMVVVCSTENEDRSHIIAAFDEYRVHATPSCASGDILKLYLADQLTCSSTKNGYYRDEKIDWHPASYLDTDKLSVRVVSSNRAGVGKTLVVTRLCESLTSLPNNDQMSKLRKPSVQLSVTVPLHGTVADTQQILDALWQHPVEANLPVSRIIHLDVSPSINEGLETVLFNLIVLGVLQDKTGRLWRRRSSDLYVIELTNRPTQVTSDSQKISFVSLFPMIDCITPRQTLQCLKTQDAKRGSSPLFDSHEFSSDPVQRTFQYLLQCDRDQSSVLDQYQYDSSRHMGTPIECLALVIKSCGIIDPSWSELKHFIDFLNSQLQDCEESYYTNPANVDDQWMQGTLKGFKSFVVRFMVTMSRDFATPSLDNSPVVCSAGLSAGDIDEDIRPLHLRRRWESSHHPYIFFNQDGMTMTFLGFHVNATGDLIDPGTGNVIEPGLLTKQLQSGLALQKVDFNTDYNKWTKQQRIDKLCMVMGLKNKVDPDTSYELTIDNMKKILAIHMRFRCGIPVVIMGETGCGKTRLIRYMCALQAGSTGQRNMLLMKVHGGTSYEDITRKVEQAEEMAAKNEEQGIDTVLFFDEANTTDALGMIKEVMVDHRVNGRPVGVGMRRLHFIAACNPYRRHTDNMIDKLESAGLGYSVKANETKDKLGKIPLRHLVYRVHALPASMRPLVWDFGQLKPEIEELYICQIVRRYIVVDHLIPGKEDLVEATARVLAAAQTYMRQQQDECSFVSLRDVERVMTVMTWFYQHRDHLRPQAPRRGSDDGDSADSADELQQRMDMVTWSLLLSLGVCYHAKLQDRKPFREIVINACISPLKPIGGQKEMLNEIDRCQKVLIDELSLGPNIARNTALSENVFMMVVCIELRIPLFVIGKPGSSKSLAKTVVADNMQGDASKSPLFKTFKRAHMVSYQCSPLSTPEGIVATFRQCRRLQKNNPGDRYASVVVLDEVGLAEDSPLLPLKTLHPLLEDGVTSSDDIIETDEKPTRVAFIGISNWALDPAKMNRGLMLMRGEPNKKELEDSARGICAEREEIRTMLSTLLKHLAAGYADLYKQQKNFKSLSSSKRDEFFGLRDFYSLVKMVYSIAAEKGEMLVWSELEHAIRRNFGGLDEIDAVKIFAKHVKSNFREVQNGEPVKTLDLLRASLDHKNAIGESRYLLVITENYSALTIVEQELNKNKDDYVVIFGSSFPKDQEYTQICRNINQIKVCMETGRTVVLLNLESLYESLYDALNQYYVYCAGQKYVDLGLGSHRVKCRVDDTFRLIVIAEKDVVYKKFPIPLINRLEKHYLVTSKGLGLAQLELVKDLKQWAKDFAEIRRHPHERQQKFHIGDAFIGYQSDTLPSMVLQVCGRDTTCDYDHPGSWTEQVKKECQSLLVECATPDAIVRLPKTSLRDKADDIRNMYFVEQEHSSLSAYLSRLLTRTSQVEEDQNGLLVQVSTHSRLLSENDLNDICQSTRFVRSDVKLLHLQQFQTEQQFTKQIRDFFIELSNNEGMMLVQCDSGDENFNLIACTRHLLIDQCNKRQEMLIEKLQVQSIRPFHVVVIVQLPRLKGGCTNFVGFQGGRWNSVHVDDLRPQVLPIESSIGRPISDLLKPSWITDDIEMSEQEQDLPLDNVDVEMTSQEEEEIEIKIDDDEIEDAEPEKTSKETFDAVVLLRRSIQAAAGRLEDEVLTKRTTDRIDMVLNLLPENSSKVADGASFAKSLHQKIYELLVEKNVRVSGSLANQWVLNEALSGTRMHERGTFRKALQYKVLSEIEPLLAKILAFVDRDRNLDLLVNQSPWLVRLWVHIFENKHLNEKYFDVSDTNMIREHVNVSGRGRHVFQCFFPFSWLIKDMVDGLARGAADVSNRSCETEEEKLRSILGNSELSDIFGLLKEEGKEEEATKHYLHDFAHMVYFPTKQYQQYEIELVSQYIMMTAQKESDQEGYIFDIATIHVTFNRVQSRINNFNQLIQTQPEVTRILLDQKRPMSIDVAALIAFLEKLEPRMSELQHAETRNDWCGKVLAIRSSIEEMTSKVVFSRQSDDSGGYEESEKELLKHCWMMWQRLSVIRIFVTHVCNTSLQESECLQYLQTLTKVLDDNTNFLRVRSVLSLERFLLQCSQDFKRNKTCDAVCSICMGESKCPSLSPCGHCFCLECITHWITDNDSCPKCREPLPDDFVPTESTEIKSACDDINQFRDHCNSFFMEVVSLFCFGYSPCGTLEEDTFKRLMGYVTGQEDAQTKPFSPFSDTMDVTPVVRSFLLQQLLKNSDKQVREYMGDFIQRAKEVVQVELCAAEVFVMCIQCMEDAHSSKFIKRTSELPLAQKINLIETNCKKASSTAARIHGNNNLDVGWLKGIAIIRFSLTLAADLMYQFVQGDEQIRHPSLQRVLGNIFDEVQKICCGPSFTRPRLFLLKQLSRRYGFESIHFVAKAFQWILPEELTGSFEVSQDQFLVYGQQYQNLRETIARSVVYGDMEAIGDVIQNMTWGAPLKNVALLLTLYHEITANPSVPIADAVRRKLHTFVQQSTLLTDGCKHLAEELITEDHQDQRTITSIFGLAGEDPWQTSMVKIIIHLAVVLRTRRQDGILGPLAALAYQPDSCINSFLPTMPDDPNQEIRAATGGTIHECPNGHPYIITECGRPTERSQCKARGCGAEIGGDNHVLVSGNRASNTADQTRRGHCLGSPANREGQAIPERGLSPLATCLVRLLVHGSMLIGSCYYMETVSQLITPNIPLDNVPRFLWEHLMRDMNLLSRASGRSVDDTSLTVHLLLENILISNSMNVPRGLGVLRDKNQRGQWENHFSTAIITPLMTNLGIRIQETMNLIANDERFGANPLLRQLYELEAGVEDTSRSIEPDCTTLWRYRTPITLDHVTRKFNESADTRSADSVILGEFLKQERELRAVKFLPDVVRLQRLLMDRYHRSLDRTETDKLRLRDFYKQIPKGSLSEYKSLVQSFRNAWNIMVASVRAKGTEGPIKKLSENKVQDDTPISMFIPAISGLGACSLALMTFLVGTHNDFLEIYSQNSDVRDVPHVSLLEVTCSQLVSYDTDRDLLPLVHAHCHYSLEIGQGTSVEYDWSAVQRHLIDRLIRGRSVIDFKADEYIKTAVVNAESVLTSLKAKISQTELTIAIQHQIIQQYRSLQDVCEALSSLNIAITFLSSGGGKTDMLMTKYLHEVLKLPEDAGLRNHKVKEVCQLQHTVSLWRLLSIERARLLTRNVKDPFEHLSDDFKTPVSEKLQMTVRESLRKLNDASLDALVALLIEIITLQLNEELDINKECSLKDYIEYNPLYKDDEVPEVEHIPDAVQLQHVFGFWQIVISLSDKSHERRIQATG